MKSPTPASLKRVTAENLARLGPERLAEILVTAAQARPELKRRLRMELAADQGSEQLAVEIDKRLGSLETSGSKISWRRRQSFIRDLDVLRLLISGRLAELDPAAALQRMWLFMELARQVAGRVKDRDGSLAAVFRRGAEDLGALLAVANPAAASAALVNAMVADPAAWAEWAPVVLAGASPELAQAALVRMAARADATMAWMALIRDLADAAGDVDSYRATFTPAGLRDPEIAAEVASRMLTAGRVAEAGQLLEAAGPGAATDYDWETVWIDYLEQAGQAEAAQAARWASFERSLSADRARAFAQRLADFEDVEAEHRAIEHARAHADVGRALQFLFDWPALPDAARLILARQDDIDIDAERASQWAAKLSVRSPEAANVLLRRGAAAAFRRRDFATSDRLTQEADNLAL